jgi:hypothetical protein
VGEVLYLVPMLPDLIHRAVREGGGAHRLVQRVLAASHLRHHAQQLLVLENKILYYGAVLRNLIFTQSGSRI